MHVTALSCYWDSLKGLHFVRTLFLLQLNGSLFTRKIICYQQNSICMMCSIHLLGNLVWHKD
jgi:hypothetical protein